MFNFEDFNIKLDSEVVGRNFIYMDEIDSTNTFLMEQKNVSDGTVLLAERQTNGKGRKGRKWYSLKDQNLTFSILLKRKFNEKKINIINLGSSLAVAYALENLYQLKINLKWPNDLLVNNQKIAGILLESSSRGNQIEKLVIGIGLNVNQTNFQGNFIIPPTSIKLETNNDIDRERVLAAILNNFEEILLNIQSSPDSVLNDWKARCRMLGEKIQVQDDNLTKSGVFDDIDKEGFLVLRTDKNKLEKIHFGDVSII